MFYTFSFYTTDFNLIAYLICNILAIVYKKNARENGPIFERSPYLKTFRFGAETSDDVEAGTETHFVSSEAWSGVVWQQAVAIQPRLESVSTNFQSIQEHVGSGYLRLKRAELIGRNRVRIQYFVANTSQKTALKAWQGNLG